MSIDVIKISDKKFGVKVGFYHTPLARSCKNSGLGFDSATKSWAFEAQDLKRVLKNLKKWFGYEKGCKFNPYKFRADEDHYGDRDAVKCWGIDLARASGRDSGAKIGIGVKLLEGKIDSGGSMKNWNTRVDTGATFEVMLPEGMIKAPSPEGWTITMRDEDIQKSFDEYFKI